MPEIKLVGALNVYSVHRFIDHFLDDQRRPRGHKYLIDICDVGFVTPVGVTSLVNLLTYLGKNGCEIVVQYPKRHTKPIEYLDDCGFFSHFSGNPLRANAKCRDTTIPLRIVGYAEYDNWLEYSVFPWLSRCLSFDIKRRWPTFYGVIGEIFNNINDHAGIDDCIASTMMQHFPNEKTIEIAISDYGVGIPTRVRTAFPDIITDDLAIMRAVEDNFSTRSTPRNRGAGLHTIIQNTVDVNGGRVSIVSGYGFVEFTRGRRDKRAWGGVDVCYPGTLLRLILRTDTIKQEDSYEEDMSW